MSEYCIKEVQFHLIPIGTIFDYYSIKDGKLFHPLVLKTEKHFDSINKGVVINAIPTAESSDSNNIGGYFFYDNDLVQPLQCRYIVI